MSKLEFYRIFVEQPLFKDAQFTLNTKQSHYLRNVLRAKEQDKIRIFNGQDGEWLALIHKIKRQCINVIIINQNKPQPPENTITTTLCFTPIKGSRQRNIIEKAIEMGVDYLQPIICQYSSVSEINECKTQEIICEATEQSESLNIAKLKKTLSFYEALDYAKTMNYVLFCDEKHNGTSNQNIHQLTKEKMSIAIFVGPEGGFSDNERKHITICDNVLPITLGPRILRADTASIVALTLVQSYFEKWQIR